MEHWRPTYHFQAPAHWMNDPNGPIQVNGVYHLFYQWNPNSDRWGDIHWGHAKSRDLVHWEHLPAALAPRPEKGELHCFSGCCIRDEDGTPVIFYTSVGEGKRDALRGAEQRIALGSADLLHWTREEGPALLDLSIHGMLEVLDWRDPFVWKDGAIWLMVLGGAVQGQGVALLYAARQPRDAWEYLGILAQGPGKAWECPNFFRLGPRHLLLYSPIEDRSFVRYQLGSFENGRFRADSEGVFDYGGRGGYYAPASFEDAQGRRIVHGWIPEDDRAGYAHDPGWNGCLAVPRVLSIEGGDLRIDPVPELKTLRQELESLSDFAWEGEYFLATAGLALEIDIKMEWKRPGAVFEIRVFSSPDGRAKTILRIDPSTGKALLDRSASGFKPGIDRSPVELDLPEEARYPQSVRIFLDHSTLEIFFDSRRTLSARTYPDAPDCNRLAVRTSLPGGILLRRLDCWKLARINAV